MKKIKRKQIDFGGTNQQYVRGDGELDNFPNLNDTDDSISVKFSSSASSISDVPSTQLVCDTPAEDIAAAIIDKKYINWFLTLTDELELVYKLSPNKATIDYTTLNTNNNGTLLYYINFDLYWYDIQRNTYLAITVYLDNTNDNTPRMVCNSRYVTEAFRSINHEPIVPGINNNISVHDGFYFPNATQDYDGNWYGAVVIGDQVWLAENLKSLHYSDGTEITVGQANNNNSAICYYPNGSQDNVDKYGMLYNWYAVTKGVDSNSAETPVIGISPGTQENGDNIWHIPSSAELNAFKTYIVRQYRYNRDSAKSILKKDNIDDTTALYNITGFGLPLAGYIEYSGPHDFNLAASFHSSTVKTDGNLNQKTTYLLSARSNNNPSIGVDYQFAYIKRSVRCICDLNPIQFRDWYIRKYGSLQHHLDENSSSETPTPVNVGNGNFIVKSDDTTVSSFSANQDSNESVNFKGGIGITLEPDIENNAITVSTESNHTVINRQTILTAEHGQTLRYYDVRCDLNGSVLKVGDLSDFVSSDKAYSYENKYVWTKQAGETGKYAGICKVQSTEGKYVFKIDFYDSIENKTTTHFFGVVADSPADATFTFISTCNWEIIVRLNSENHRLLAYLKIPDEFVGTITLTPLRRTANSMNNEGLTSSFDYSTGTTIRDYYWYTELTQNDGVQNVNTVTELAENAPETSSSSSGNYLRTPTGNYYVNVMGDFGGNLQVGSKVSDSVINDYYIHTIEKRLQDFATAAAIYNLLNLPQPTSGDEGKVLTVDANGQYQLVDWTK